MRERSADDGGATRRNSERQWLHLCTAPRMLLPDAAKYDPRGFRHSDARPQVGFFCALRSRSNGPGVSSQHSCRGIYSPSSPSRGKLSRLGGTGSRAVAWIYSICFGFAQAAAMARSVLRARAGGEQHPFGPESVLSVAVGCASLFLSLGRTGFLFLPTNAAPTLWTGAVFSLRNAFGIFGWFFSLFDGITEAGLAKGELAKQETRLHYSTWNKRVFNAIAPFQHRLERAGS